MISWHVAREAKTSSTGFGPVSVPPRVGGSSTVSENYPIIGDFTHLGTREWFVIHHTNCGMELFTDDVIGDLLADNLETAHFDGNVWSNPKHGHGASAGQFIKWHTIKDQPSSVVHDVRYPLVSPHIRIYGYIYDVYSGNLVEVTEATKAGQPR